MKRKKGAKGKRNKGDKPKRPLSAFMNFCKEKRPEVKASHPDKSFTEVHQFTGLLTSGAFEHLVASPRNSLITHKSRHASACFQLATELGALWNALSKEEKDAFKSEAAEEGDEGEAEGEEAEEAEEEEAEEEEEEEDKEEEPSEEEGEKPSAAFSQLNILALVLTCSFALLSFFGLKPLPPKRAKRERLPRLNPQMSPLKKRRLKRLLKVPKQARRHNLELPLITVQKDLQHIK